MVDQYIHSTAPTKKQSICHRCTYVNVPFIDCFPPVKSTAQLKPPLKRMDAAPVPYENVKDDSLEVEVAAVANGERSNGGVVVAAERDEGDPFRTDHVVDVQRKLVSLQAPDSPAVPLRRRKVVVAAASGRGFCVYRKVTCGVRSCSLSLSPSFSCPA